MTDQKKPETISDEDLDSAQGGMTVLTTNENILTTNENVLTTNENVHRTSTKGAKKVR